jgi:transcriptional regulator with XRE-family HTH domain
MSSSGETDETVAAKVDVSRVQISRIRRGLHKPSPRLAARLEEITGVSAWEFLRPETTAA